MSNTVPQAEIPGIRSNPQFQDQVVQSSQLATYMFGFNTTKPPFNNQKVREAFSLAIDRKTLAELSVQEVIGGGLAATVQLGLLAAALAVLVGVPLGVLAALKQNSPLDYGSMFLAITGYTTPAFVLGIFLIVIFAVNWHMLPPGGWGRPLAMIMPVVTLAAAPTAILARYTRASMLDIRGQDYVRTARAKGLRERAVVVRHMLRNALLPVVTVLGPVVAALVTGSFIVETVFRVPGVGRLYINAIFARDYPLIMGTTLLYAVAVAVFNLVVDVLYVVVDPRISYE